MRLLALALLCAAVAAGTLGGDADGFKLTVPDDWDIVAPRKDAPGLKAHVRTWFGEDEASTCDAELYVFPARKEPLVETVAAWRARIEAGLDLTGRDAREATLDGVPCHVLEMRGEGFAFAYRIATKGDRLYVLTVQRRGRAVDDKGIAEEADGLVASVRLLAKDPPAAEEASPPAPPATAPVAADEISFDHWRLECVKPEGLHRAEPTIEERASGILLRLEGRGDQQSCVIRVYAFLAKAAGHRRLDEVADWIVAHWEKEHPDETRRLPVEMGRRWDIPLVKEARTLRLVAKEAVLVTRLWYLAECRNGRQYWVEVTLRGTQAEATWREAVAAFLEGFEPQRKG